MDSITENRKILDCMARDCAALLTDETVPLLDRFERVKKIIGNGYNRPLDRFVGIARVQGRLNPRISEIHWKRVPGMRYEIGAGSPLVSGGVLKRGMLWGCPEITELVVGEGIVELEDGWQDGLMFLRRLYLPASLEKIGGYIHNPVEEVVFGEGCKCMPRFDSSCLTRVVWPSGCDTCDADVFKDFEPWTHEFFGEKGDLGPEIVGFEAVKRIDAEVFRVLRKGKTVLPREFELMGLRPDGDFPLWRMYRDKAVSLLATVRDLSLPVVSRVDAWLELTSSNACICSLPDEERHRALASELPVLYGIRRTRAFGDPCPIPRFANAAARMVLDEIESDNYRAMRIRMDLGGVGLTPKMLDFAWGCGSAGVIAGLVRDKHPQVVAWARNRPFGPLGLLLDGLDEPDVADAIAGTFPEVAKSQICGCSRLLWETFLDSEDDGGRRLYWSRWHDDENMRKFVEKCDENARRMIALGADPDMKGDPLQFSWNDILDGLCRRCSCPRERADVERRLP